MLTADSIAHTSYNILQQEIKVKLNAIWIMLNGSNILLDDTRTFNFINICYISKNLIL